MAVNPDFLKKLFAQLGMMQGTGAPMGGMPGQTPPIVAPQAPPAAMAQPPMGPQAQPPVTMPPPPQVPMQQSLMDRFRGGLGNMVMPTGGPDMQGLSPEQQQQMQSQAMQRMKLGMLAGLGQKPQGRGLLGGLANAAGNFGQAGLGAQASIGQDIAQFQRQKTHADETTYQRKRDTVGDKRYQDATAHQSDREKIEDARADQERTDRVANWKDEIKVRRAALTERTSPANPVELAKLGIEERNYKRSQVLLAKPIATRTRSENIELDALLGGSVSREAAARAAQTKADDPYGIKAALGDAGGGAKVPTYNPATGKFE